MDKLLERFLQYVSLDTQSKPGVRQVPSTEGQWKLLRLLQAQLQEMGLVNVTLSEKGTIMGTLPANVEGDIPAIGFISHVDTSPDFSGKNVNPQIVENYRGGDIALGIGDEVLSPVMFPILHQLLGQTLITTDGKTLLGADDKAGVAEIMTLAQRLLAPDAPAHGTIRIGFTPDEEVGRGVDLFDVAAFGAEFGYTVDGGELGDLNYECFNAASAEITIKGFSVHTGSAKGRMINASLVAMELHALLPMFENPTCTENYEGFFHLDEMNGCVDHAFMHYIVRDHDMEKFTQKKALIQSACDYMNLKYGAGTVTLSLSDTYYNMKSKVPQFVVEAAMHAMESVGVTPLCSPIRGGTDGSRLSYMGLPCPNICTGGYNFHGRYEFITTQAMEKVVDILTALVTSFVA